MSLAQPRKRLSATGEARDVFLGRNRITMEITAPDTAR